MIYIRIKGYNKNLLTKFSTFLNTLKITKSIKGPIILPSKYKQFTVKTSPHVLGRSKENYLLRTFNVLFVLKVTRKKDQLFLLKLLKNKHFEGLGLKISLS